MITALYLGLFGFALAFLFLRVVRLRWTQKVSLGDGGNIMLQRAISVHRNFIETVPYIIILMFFVEQAGYPGTVIHVMGAVMIVSRILHFMGITYPDNKGNFRVLGSVVFIIMLLTGSVLSVLSYVM